MLLRLLQQLSSGHALVPSSYSTAATAATAATTTTSFSFPRATIPVLDCLLPQSSSSSSKPTTPSRTHSSRSISRNPAGASIPHQCPTAHRRFRTPPPWQQTRSNRPRALSTTPHRRRTVPFYNPPDEPSVLEITSRAATRLATIAEKDQNPNLALRIQVESGGCHGFQYLMSLVTLPGDLSAPTSSAAAEAADKNAIREDDTIFSFVDDSVPEGSMTEAELKPHGAKIILDGPSLDLLQGSKVDFTQELIGSQFSIIDNPRATSSCGCGTSFDIKLD